MGLAAVIDVLETRLNLAGLSAYTSGMGKAGGAVDTLARRHQRFGQGALFAGAAAVAGMGFYVKAARAAADEQEQFNRASGNFKGGFDVSALEAYATGLENVSRFSDEAIADALGLAGAMGLSASAAKELARASANAAEATRAKGTTLQSAVEAGSLAVASGQTRRLRQLGIFLDQTAFTAATTEERLRMVTAAMDKLGGSDAALKGTKSLSGSLDQLNNALENVEESFGKAGGGPLTKLVQGGTGLVNLFNKLPDYTKQVVSIVGIGLVAAAGIAAIKLKFLEKRAYDAMIQFSATAVAATAMNKAIGATPVASPILPAGGAVPGTAAIPKALPGAAVNTGLQVAGATAAATAGAAAVKKAGAVQRLTPSIGDLSKQVSADATRPRVALPPPTAVMANRPGPIVPLPGSPPVSKAGPIQRVVQPVVDLGARFLQFGGGKKPAAAAAVQPGAAALNAAGSAAKAAPVPAVGLGAKAAGLGGKVLGAAKSPLGLGLAATALSLAPNTGNEIIDQVKKVAERALTGASFGAAIGTAFGGIGAVPGGLIGAGLGVAGGIASDVMTAPKQAPPPVETPADKTNALLEKQNALLAQIAKGEKAVDFAGLSVVQQRGIMNAARAVA